MNPIAPNKRKKFYSYRNWSNFQFLCLGFNEKITSVLSLAITNDDSFPSETCHLFEYLMPSKVPIIYGAITQYPVLPSLLFFIFSLLLLLLLSINARAFKIGIQHAGTLPSFFKVLLFHHFCSSSFLRILISSSFCDVAIVVWLESWNFLRNVSGFPHKTGEMKV